ncbi:RING finger ubiquitin ligase (Tul1), putative [Talaromyces stipitatus ATCC 10500]|uniref:RING-type E3 ubiquitin transferase n=1 Tax=Talaromyces stipitatus (strain ATCC 10500 / CBS 375.48 / QM 6759 / NRRL 1006) TaxID=441959 RepID=B8MK38_TALSN|nr:RING finger ubiquitin ligase (Tul1), putative [Talaromyces stipitatus ATCC 10500]EED14855.1 RING finger ubiquitin ligase (Tul1), putative [Talaromyces stipitatus ATCC 10500]
MDNRGGFFFFVVAVYILLSSSNRAPLIDQTGEREARLAHEANATRWLNDSVYDDLDPQADKWLPIAGLRQNDSYSWDLLPQAQQIARRNIRSALKSGGFQSPPELELPDQAPSVNLSSLSLPVYRNITGKLRGDWTKHAVPHGPLLNTTALMQENDFITQEFGLNITGETGRVYVDFVSGDEQKVEQYGTSVRQIRADLAFESDAAWGSTWYMSTFGLHFPDQGAIILTTTSEKYDGLLALPHLTLSHDTFNISREAMVQILSDNISRKRRYESTFFPWSSLPRGVHPMAFATPKCEYILYIQQRPVNIGGKAPNRTLLDKIEQELRFPAGIPIPPPPMIEMSFVVFSPDCGILLESKGAPDFPPSEGLYVVGPKQEEYRKFASRTIYSLGAIMTGQLYLLMRQIKEASTPSTRSRISFYSIALMSLGDAMVMTMTLLALFEDTSFIEISATAFLVFLSVCYIGMRFMMEVWAVQVPERRNQDRHTETNNNQDSLPPPVTAAAAVSSGATPVVLPPDQTRPNAATPAPTTTPGATQPNNTMPSQSEIGADVGTMYARFYFVLGCVSIVTLWSFLFPSKIGAIYAKIISFVYLSFWIPQIYRNIMRNCRKALTWEFVIGESILRLVPFVYFLTARGNVLFVRPDTTTALAMAGWVWVQAWILASQDILGPRFFVPNGWAPPAYDYHPVIHDTSRSGTGDDLESGTTLPIGYLRAEERDTTTPSTTAGSSRGQADKPPRPKDKKKKIFDCAICMQDIEVPVIVSPNGIGASSMTDGASSILSRRAYMHMFGKLDEVKVAVSDLP